MSKSLNVSDLGKVLGGFFTRYHAIIFVVLALGSLIVATLILSGTVEKSSAQPAQTTGITFDKETIKKLDKLKTVDEQTNNRSAPMGNRSPFVE